MSKELTIEQRELYCYATGTSPFSDKIVAIDTKVPGAIIRIRAIVLEASKKYDFYFGDITKTTSCFTKEDRNIVSNYIREEMRSWNGV